MPAPRKVIVLSGPVSSGKSTLGKGLARFGFEILKTRDIIARTAASEDRLAFQKEGDRLDTETRGRWVLDELAKLIRSSPSSMFVVDSVRIKEQIEHIRGAYRQVVHVHLTAPLGVLEQRYNERIRGRLDQPFFSRVRENSTEANVESLQIMADAVIDTNRCLARDVLARALGHLAPHMTSQRGYVDLIVGGQYGSEGKGQVAAYIAPEYDLLVRVGGPNAGHKVFENPPYTHYQLPSGTRRCDAKLLLAPGMVINVDKLRKETSECGVSANRLRIDPQVMIISEEDIGNEERVRQRIGSTKQGVGRATARRITNREPGAVKLARDVEELKPYLQPASDVLAEAYARGDRVLVEGTQGFGLSLFHGSYPHVTSRDTSVSGCLSEAGIPPSRVRRVVMVCRTYPIRVQNPEGGTSGPMSTEIGWEEIGARSGIPIEELKMTEKTSTTNRDRRVAEFDWDLLRRASLANGPTDIAVTFADYHSVKNRDAKRIEQLQPETINFIEDVERVSGAHVSLISTGFNPRPIIDRRKW